MDDDLVFADSAGHTIIDLDAAREAHAENDHGGEASADGPDEQG